MAWIKTPAYLKMRDGRPRWEPGPALRAAGWGGRDLKSVAGAWLGVREAIAAAEALNDEVAVWRAGGGGKRPRRRPQAPQRTVQDLHAAWIASPEFRLLRSATREDYLCKAAVFVSDFADAPVAAISRKAIKGWWRTLYDQRGHAMANGTVAVARVMLTFACDEQEWIAQNPALKLGLPGVPPRIVVWLPGEVEAAVRVADDLNCHALGDAIVIALHTGQRQADVLALEDARTEGGRCRFRQAKTNAQVAVPTTDQLARRLDAIKRRRAHLAGVVDLDLARRVVLSCGAAYSGDRLRKDFQMVRALVANEHPGIAERTFADLRDTAVTRLALADCTVAEIRAITGHSLETVHSVLKHYLALDDRMAASAIGKLQTWMAREGIAL